MIDKMGIHARLTKLLLSAACCLLAPASQAQEPDTVYGMRIMMDEVVIRAVRKGWDVSAFIRRMQTDTTFYKAFLGLKMVNYESENEMFLLDETQHASASLHNRTLQRVQDGCREVRVTDERTTGRFYNRKGDPLSFTGEMFRHLFFRAGRECGLSDRLADVPKPSGKLEKSKEQLKQLVFNPGSKIGGIPFVGDKASVFDADMQLKYDFSLKYVNYEGEECYLFSAVPKPGSRADVVFNRLDTWFRIRDYSIMARDYSLSYHTLVYDFDVQMKVRLEQKDGRLLPATIDYRGNWHVAMKKRERSILSIVFDY